MSCGSRRELALVPDAGAALADDAAVDEAPSLILFDGSNQSGGKQGLSCSSDLHDIIDSDGGAVQQCAPDQGCAVEGCVAACRAAGENHGNVGCDFMPATPSFAVSAQPGYGPPCWVIFMANNWTKAATITVTYDGASYDVTRFGRIPVAGTPEATWPPVPASGLPQGQVAVLFISSDPTSNFQCPIPGAMGQGTAVSGTGLGKAWHISTDVPVSAYDILPYGGAASFLPGASLLLPTTAWGTNYIAVVPKFASNPGRAPGPQWAQIVASEDGTTVQIAPTLDLPAGPGIAAAPLGQVTSYMLNAGEFIQWQNGYDYSSGGATPMEMSGSVISSDKPVAFYGGNGYMCLTAQSSVGGGCDSDHEQFSPVTALGSEYAPAPYATRRADLQAESVIYRIVGAMDGTRLSYDPPVSGAPLALDRGQWVDFEASVSFVVASQDGTHPFQVGQMMSGCHVTSGSRPPGGCLGDEDYVNVMPPAQFLRSYVFFTDGSYPTTTLTFVRRKTSSGFSDVQLDCLGVITGWQPIDSSQRYEWTSVDLVRGNVGAGQCQNGPHTATSQGPFGLTVWGEAEQASYGYPAGTSVAAINTVVVRPLPK